MKSRIVSRSLCSMLLVGLTSCTAIETRQSSRNNAQATTEIRINSSSSAVAAMDALTKAYQTQTPTAKLNILPKGQAETAIAGVKNNLIDMAFITRPLKPEESSSNIKYHKLAKDGLLVATHSSVTGIKNLTTENLKAIYSGKVKNWQELGGPDAEIIVLDRPEDESAKRLLRKHYLGADLPNSPTAVVLKQEGELITALTNTPNAIGAFSLAYAISKNLPVNHLSLNGIAPTHDHIATGKYPMVRQLGIVTQNTPNQSTQSFLNFIQSPGGANALESVGFTIDRAAP